MKKTIVTGVLAMVGFVSAMAGGLTTNTNYHIAFDRMMARGATFEIDGAFSNPAGLVWGHEGFQLSFNWQSPHQDRDVETTYSLFNTENNNNTRKFSGKATAPFVPGLFAAYRHDRLAVSFMLGIVGSGGYVKYDDGLPMFSAPVTALLNQALLAQDPRLAAAGYNMLTVSSLYNLDSQMKGKQYVYGAQVSAAYRIAECWSVAAAFRANYYDGYYRGHVLATMKQTETELVNMQLDCDQTGWGYTPQLSVNFHKDKLTLTARYEFRTKIETENATNKLSISPENVALALSQSSAASMLAAYQDGAKTRNDLPALFSAAVGYEFLPSLRAMVEFHVFDDKNAHMPNERQKALKHGTREYLAGVEWNINKMFLVSAGGQRTDYGLSDEFQSNTSFACDSYSVGFGGAININEHLRLNASYFWTMYDDYKVSTSNYMGTGLAGTDVYSRTNKVFGLGIDYRF